MLSFIEIIRPWPYVVEVYILGFFCLGVKIFKSNELSKSVDHIFVIVKLDDALFKHWNILLGKSNREIRSNQQESVSSLIT